MKHLVEDHKERNIPIPEEEIVRYLKEIAFGLKELHSRRIIHKNIKPANILLTADNHIKLTDFGMLRFLAKSFPTTVNDTSEYESPELCYGQPYAESSDIWALGCVAYELCYLNVFFLPKYKRWFLKEQPQ